MEIPGNKIASSLEKLLKRQVKSLGKKHQPKLTTILVGSLAEQISYVKIKAKIAKRLGIRFEFKHLKATPSFEKFMQIIKEQCQNPQVNGVIIQQPLPAQLSTDSIYEYVPLAKEIEGHKRKSPFLPPIGLATLTLLKYVFTKPKKAEDLIVDINRERIFFKKIFRNKKVVLVGRGITGGHPIGKTLTDARINFINVNSQTPEPESYYKEADLIISAVGKNILTSVELKPGVVLINVGLRREKGKLLGDYDEKEVKNIAGFYTSTPGGIGPIDVLYLFKNLIDATKMQI